MSSSPSGAGVRAIAFGSADGGGWGAALSDGESWSLVIGPEPDFAPGAGPVHVTEDPGGGWRLERENGSGGAELSLVATADEPPTPPSAPAAGHDAGDEPPLGALFVPGEGPELCRVTGTVSGTSVDWRGVLLTLEEPRSAKEAPGYARVVAGWFPDGSAVGLIAARPRRSDRPDADALSATLFDPERWLAVSDPRLSTTYDAAGTPSRVNLELWIGEGEHEYPRRAAGEASGVPSAATSSAGTSSAGTPSAGTEGGVALQVVPLRCHSRGQEGAGVYVLATL